MNTDSLEKVETREEDSDTGQSDIGTEDKYEGWTHLNSLLSGDEKKNTD